MKLKSAGQGRAVDLFPYCNKSPSNQGSSQTHRFAQSPFSLPGFQTVQVLRTSEEELIPCQSG